MVDELLLGGRCGVAVIGCEVVSSRAVKGLPHTRRRRLLSLAIEGKRWKACVSLSMAAV